MKKSAFSASLIYFIVVCVFCVIRMLNSFHLLSFMGEVGNYIVNGFLQIGMLLLFSILMFKIMNKKSLKRTFRDFNYERISFKVVLISIGLGVVVYFLNVFVSSFFYAILESLGYSSSSGSGGGVVSIWTLVLGLIFTAILPAICEENLHRGMLLTSTSGLGMKNSILLTGLMFGLLHLNIEQFFYATLIGFFLGFVCYVSGSIYPCMIIHFMNNGISVLLSYLTASGTLHGGFFTQLNTILANNVVVGFVVMFITILVLVILLVVLTRLLLKVSFEDSIREKQKVMQNLATRVNYLNDVEKIKGEEAENEKMFMFMSMEEIKKFMQDNPDAIVVPKPKREKSETRTKILLIASIVLSSAVTLFTLIWGIIC